MSRADALKALVARLEAESPVSLLLANRAKLADAAFWAAYEGSLDAVASLEAPLRARGWTWDRHDNGAGAGFTVLGWSPRDTAFFDPVSAEAPTEPRARLLAVLRALLHEQEHPQP